MKRNCDICGKGDKEVNMTCFGENKMFLCEGCYLLSLDCEKTGYYDIKTNLRCINCGKKLKKRIYTNGKISYICENCRRGK